VSPWFGPTAAAANHEGLFHGLADGALADPVAQLPQFIADPFGTPRSILNRHLMD
jgi:hypothetical protein